MEEQNQQVEQSESSKAEGGMNKGIIILVVVILLLVAGFFFLNANKGESLGPTPEQEETGTPQPEAASDQIQEIVVEGKEFSFAPDSLTVKSGEVVRIVFKNVGKMEHDFIIDELDVATAVINPGEEQVVQFVAGEPGSYSYYCGVGSHRSLGMEGTLTIE